jgi:hypothetical protein
MNTWLSSCRKFTDTVQFDLKDRWEQIFAHRLLTLGLGIPASCKYDRKEAPSSQSYWDLYCASINGHVKMWGCCILANLDDIVAPSATVCDMRQYVITCWEGDIDLKAQGIA